MICRHMIDTNHAQMLENGPVSAEELFAYADQHEIFASFNGMVCAGSTKKIMEFLEFCLTEMNNAFSGTTEFAKNTSSSRLGQIIDDVDRWYRYAISSIELDCFIKIERRTSRVGQDQRSSNYDERTIETYREISEYCRSLTPLPCAVRSDSFEMGSLTRQNEILSLLNRRPIKAIKQSLLNEQLSFD